MAWLGEGAGGYDQPDSGDFDLMEKFVPVELGSNPPYSYVGDLCRIVHAKLANFNHLFGNEFGHRIIAINQAKRAQGEIERPVQQLDLIRVELAAPHQAVDWHSQSPSAPKETPGRLDSYPVRNREKNKV
jgi:hypothetical protein